MASVIAWLDTSPEEQRRGRELITLFAQNESHDELGIGQFRDALSNTLFPGTSVIQTRARYFLFVPWIYQQGMRRRYAGQQLTAWKDRRERRLIEARRNADDVEGLIGRLAGPAVNVLPSAIYWSGLARYGILTRDIASDQLTGPTVGSAAAEADELATRVSGDWNPTVPPAPEGFPDRVEGGFGLLHDEAAWLAEQITKTAGGTLLAHLLTAEQIPDPASPAPSEDSACATAPAHLRSQLEHAWMFSLGMHGAALLYNLLIGERYEAAGHTRVDQPVADYRERLERWAEDCAAVASQLASWNRQQMWDLVLHANPRVGPLTRQFADTWLDTVAGGSWDSVADWDDLRTLVSAREQQKKKQSRLVNDRLLRTWSGESGSAQLTYRWPQVRRIITDIPVAAREAVRSCTDRVDIFCQAGQITIPGQASDLMAFLEPTVHEVRRPRPGHLFRPKLWLLRYRADSEPDRYRLLCPARDLTHDHSWDIALRLDGMISGGRETAKRPLAELILALPGLATAPLANERRDRIAALAAEARADSSLGGEHGAA